MRGFVLTRLRDKVALVTGGASGIGRDAALLLAEEGASVVVTDVDPEGKTVADDILKAGKRSIFVQGDTSDEEDAENIVGRTLKEFGRLDVLFNNAGTNVFGGVHELDRKDWDRLLAVNLTGYFLVAKHSLKHMMTERTGSIINNASTFGLMGWERDAAYCASKGAVIALTRQMAVDYAPYNIRANCICPGPTLTPRIERIIATSKESEKLKRIMISPVLLRRFANPREIAYAVLFLASDEASFVTGTSLVVDGGQTTHVYGGE
jgi:NAD(P)-dependent dehydrogenase (short-subunit alcohol dehydrogenase family)